MSHNRNNHARYLSKERIRRKRRQKRRKQLFKILQLSLMILVVSGLLLAFFGRNRIKDTLWNHNSADEEEIIENLTAEVSGTGNNKLNEILAHQENYPIELLELLNKNPETLEFVYNYPLKKDLEYSIDISQELQSGEVPLFIQWDERWGYSYYGDSMMAINGCGPTCLAMVASSILQDAKLNPKWMAEFSEENGYVSEKGTLWALMSQGARKLGLESIEIPLDETRVLNNLEVGNLIICSMGPGDFTTEGHFIVLAGTKNGKLIVHDPNSRENSEKLWKFDDIKSQIKNIWVFR